MLAICERGREVAEGQERRCLDLVAILELIHQQVVDLGHQLPPYDGVGGQEVSAAQQQVVEVHGIALSHELDVVSPGKDVSVSGEEF